MNTLDETLPKKSPKDIRRIKTIKLLSKSLVYAFAIFGIVFIVVLFAILSMLKPQGSYVANVPDRAVLNIDFDINYMETKDNDLMSELAGFKAPNFLDLIKVLNMAAVDDRIKALVGEVSVSSLGLAQIQDLRQTIINFRKSGKKAYLYSKSFGSFGQGTKEYYLATAFDEIVLMPNSELGLTGIGIEVPFVRNVLNKIGVKPEFYSRYEYKTAMDNLTGSKMSQAYKSELDKLGSGLFNRMVEDIAAARNIPSAELKKLINQAPLFSGEAFNAKLIDRVSFKQDFIEDTEKQHKAEMVDFFDYATNITDNEKGVPAIAYLVIDGVIVNGESSSDSLQDEIMTGADTVLSQLKEIDEDENIKALVLRVNSPGGEYGAANEIMHGIEQLKLKKKIPVIVSMGDYAASGGYFVALAGDKIVAEPSSITGSIGVLGGKMVLQELWQKIGVNWERVAFGQNAGILSANTPFSNQEKAIFNKSLDIVYSDFTSKVAKARNISEKEMDKLARGRVWLGEQAVQNKLADSIGGIDTALLLAQKAAKIEDNEKIRIEFFPKELSLQEKLQRFLATGQGIIAPKISVLDKGVAQLKLLNRLKYDAVLPPMQIEM